jgi:L-rhamnose mutarotase
MQRKAFLLGLKSDDPAVRAAYVARHEAIWPEMSALLTEAGMRNYSIFRLGTQLFAYCEVDDWEATQRRLNDSAVNARTTANGKAPHADAMPITLPLLAWP